MRLITCHGGRLQAMLSEGLGGKPGGDFFDGVAGDRCAASGGWAGRGAVHEILGEPGGAAPLFFAVLLARAAVRVERSDVEETPTLTLPRSTRGGEKSVCHRAIVWCDPGGSVYAPALAAAGIDLERVYFLRPANARDLLWGMAESLRCPGVGAVIGVPGGLSRIEARRLQLAAETGGGTGLILRVPLRGRQSHYAAATRWRGQPRLGGSNRSTLEDPADSLPWRQYRENHPAGA